MMCGCVGTQVVPLNKSSGNKRHKLKLDGFYSRPRETQDERCGTDPTVPGFKYSGWLCCFF